MTFIPAAELQQMGFRQLGRNVMLSSKASIYGVERISLGDSVRIDDYCVLSAGAGGMIIGSNIHIAVYSSLIGAGTITLGDYCNLSSRVAIYSSNDDYSGSTMTNPMVPERFKAVDSRPVTIGRHVIIGCGAVILPGVTLGDGVAIGALSLIKEDCDAFGIYAGAPARRCGARRQDLLQIELNLKKDLTDPKHPTDPSTDF